MNRYLAVLAAVCLCAPAAMPAAANPAGVWEGTLKTPNGDVTFLFNLHRDGDKWAAEMDIAIQRISGLPLANVKVDGAAVGFTLPGPGDPQYDGKLADDGKTIAGNLTAGGQPLPLDSKWKSEARAVEKLPANTGDVQVLEGVWEGVLEPPGRPQLHVRFNFVKNADGSITGTFDSLDQAASGLPISSIARTGDTVKLDMKAIGCSYEGILNKEASAITGNFTQGDSIPLTLQRKPAEKKS